jgi:hypothetical protein
LITYEDIEAACGGRVSLRTIAARVPLLIKEGLGIRPDGKGCGTTISEPGKDLVRQINSSRST